MKRFPTLLLGLLALILILLPGAAQAQSPLVLDELIVRVWPEFDQPAALVFYIGQLSADTPLPAEVTIQIPEGAVLHAVAYEDSAGLVSTDFEQNGTAITLTTPTGSVWVEFYDDLAIDGAVRTYNRSFAPGLEVRNLIWGVQHPGAASGFAVSAPSDGTLTQDQYGLPVTEAVLGSLAAGASFDLSFSYSNSQGTLSVDLFSAAEPAPEVAAPAAAAGLAAPPAWLTVLLLVIGFAAIGGGVYWYATIQRPASKRAGTAPRKASRGRFCTSCGELVDREDTFCRHCGVELR